MKSIYEVETAVDYQSAKESNAPLSDMVDESKRIIAAAQERGIILRLFGGMAVRLRCPSAAHRSLQRKNVDIDFMGLRKQAPAVKKLFPELGYAPRTLFNALSEDQRLIFNDITLGRRIDVFMDIFSMCHVLDLRNRLALDKLTIPLADLLFTKLQVVEITEREYKDTIALVHDHEIGESDDPEQINAKYLAALCASDWGIYKTLTINITRILGALPGYKLESNDEQIVRSRLEDLAARIEQVPKGIRWKARAKIGERRPWYELPEADKEVVDSRPLDQRSP